MSVCCKKRKNPRDRTRVKFWSNGGMSSKHDSSTPIREGSNHITVGIVTISDRASAGDYDDLGGPAVKEAAQKAGWQVLAEAIVPDDAARIKKPFDHLANKAAG